MTAPNETDMTMFAQLVQAERSANEARRFHNAEADKYERVRDECREQLAILMGDKTVGVIDGKQVLRRTPSKSFAWARFREENPEMYEEYKVAKLGWEVDTDKLKAEQPQVYARYRGTTWTNASEVL